MHVYEFVVFQRKKILKGLNENLMEFTFGAVGKKDGGNRTEEKQRKGEVYTFTYT